MTVLRTESFVGGAGALDATWTQQRTAGTVNYDGSGNAGTSGAATNPFAFDNSNTYPADQYVKIQLGGGLTAGNDYAMALTRASLIGDANYKNYTVYTDGGSGAGHTEFGRITADTLTILRSFATTFVTGDWLELRSVGNDHEVFKIDGGTGVRTSLGNFVDGTHAAGSAGLGLDDRAGGTSPLISAWEGGSAVLTTLYLNNPVQGGANAGLLDTSAPTASTSTTGWTVGATTVNQHSRQTYNSEIPTTGFTGTAQPSGAPVNLGEDCYRLSGVTTGQFSAGTWYSSVSVIAVTSGGIQQGRARFRLWRSASADGTSATELTQGAMIGSQVTELNTLIAQSSSASTLIAASNLTSEFLFQQIAWETL